MLPSSEWLVTQKTGVSLLVHQSDADQTVASIGPAGDLTAVSKRDFRHLALGEPLTQECMEIFSKLFQHRDNRVAEVHHDVNHQRNSYQKFGRTIFLGNKFCSNLTSTLLPDHIALLVQQHFPREGTIDDDVAYIVLMMNTSFVIEVPDCDSWSMIRIDIRGRCMEYCDPRLDRNSISEFTKTSLQNTATNIIQPVLRVIFPTYDGMWPISILQHQFFTPLPVENQSDCGVYLISCIYFSIQSVPIFFDQDCINRLRKQLAYWILCGSLQF